MPSTPTPEASHHADDWGVSRCDCGHFTLRLGALRVDLSPDDFDRLVFLLREAGDHFGARPRPRDTSVAAATTH